jgi:glycosyltransferase involved in cell wall biosynthesis
MTTRKKILHLITGLEVGGAETMLLKTLPATQKDFDHLVCSIVGMGPVGDMLEDRGIKIHHLDLNGFYDLGIVNRLYQTMVDFKPHALITYLPHADILGRIIGRSAGIKPITSSIRVKLNKSKYLPFFILDGLTSPLVNHYHFNSQTLADIHHRLLKIPNHKIHVIPNAVEVDKYDLTINKNSKKAELNIHLNKTVIGCVARLRKQKGHKYLISSFFQIHKKRPDTLLLLVGDGEQKKDLVKQINSLGLQKDVIFLGNRHDVSEILQLIDVFVLTTLFEGMSNSLMEAMSARRPIITTSITENQELITHNQTGLLVPTKDINSTTKAVINLIDHPQLAQKLGESAHVFVKNKFNTPQIVSLYHQFYASL